MSGFDKNNLPWKLISPFMNKIENGEVSKSWTTDHYGDDKSFSDFRIPVSAIANVAQRQLLTFMVASRFRYTSLNSVYENEREIIKIANHQVELKELFDMIVFHKFIVRNPQMRLNYDAFITEEWKYMADSYADLYNQFYPFWNTPKIFKCLINVSSQYDIKKYGAVNTPHDLVKEIVNRIPDKAFDENVLDPACGHGTFLYEAKQRMMKNGLSSDDAINNIYGVDIDLRKCYISSAILNPEGEKVSNIFWANALTGTNQENPTKQAWTEMKFKVVLGNPPYKAGLYQKIFNKAVDVLNDGGYVSFIIPATMILNRKDVNESNEKKNFLNYLQKHKVDITIKAPSVFGSADMFGDVAVVLLNKVISDSLIKSITYKNGLTYNDVPLDGINHLGLAPELYISFRKKYEAYIQANGSLNDITVKNSNCDKVYGAYIQGVRGDIRGGLSDNFYTLISKNADYHVSSLDKDNGQVVKCRPDQLRNVFAYMRTFIARFGLALSKINQQNARGEFKTVPLVDFDKVWSDDDLARLLGLTDAELELIYSILPDYHDLLRTHGE